jgi:hypothetical protein
MTTQQPQPQVSALSALLRTHAGGTTPTPSRPGTPGGTPVVSPVVGHAAVVQGFSNNATGTNNTGNGNGGDGNGSGSGSQGSEKVGARPING